MTYSQISSIRTKIGTRSLIPCNFFAIRTILKIFDVLGSYEIILSRSTWVSGSGSRKVPRISDSGSQSSVFDIGIIASPMARESVCFRFLLFLSKTLVFLSSEYPELSWKIGNRDLKSAEHSWNRIRISTWILKV